MTDAFGPEQPPTAADLWGLVGSGDHDDVVPGFTPGATAGATPGATATAGGPSEQGPTATTAVEEVVPGDRG